MTKPLTLEQRKAMPEYVPADFIPRGPMWPTKAWQRLLLNVTLIDLLFPLRCEKFHGTVSRIERHDQPNWFKRASGSHEFGGVYGSRRHGLIWLEEEGDMMIGYAGIAMLHETKVGDEITIWVKPWSGSARRLRNRTRPRRWWQY